MKKPYKVTQKLNTTSETIKEMIDEGEINYELRNGIYYVDEDEVKMKMKKKQTPIDSVKAEAFNSLEEMFESIENNKPQIKSSTEIKLRIDTSHINEKNQNDFMGNEKLRIPNPMDIITLHNEILNGEASEKNYGSDVVDKIEKLYCTLSSYIDGICVYGHSIELTLNGEIDESENFYSITKELSKHFFNDIEKINQHLPTLTKLSYGDNYTIHKSSLIALYVALYIEATLDVGSKGNM
jgi:hypothetical protein